MNKILIVGLIISLNLNRAAVANPIFNYTTFSNGRSFSMQGRNLEFTRNSVMQRCEVDRYTSSGECDANVSCH